MNVGVNDASSPREQSLLIIVTSLYRWHQFLRDFFVTLRRSILSHYCQMSLLSLTKLWLWDVPSFSAVVAPFNANPQYGKKINCILRATYCFLQKYQGLQDGRTTYLTGVQCAPFSEIDLYMVSSSDRSYSPSCYCIDCWLFRFPNFL